MAKEKDKKDPLERKQSTADAARDVAHDESTGDVGSTDAPPPADPPPADPVHTDTRKPAERPEQPERKEMSGTARAPEGGGNQYISAREATVRRLVYDLERRAAKGHGLDEDRRLMAAAAMTLRDAMGLEPDEPLIPPDSPPAPHVNEPPMGHSLAGPDEPPEAAGGTLP